MKEAVPRRVSDDRPLRYYRKLFNHFGPQGWWPLAKGLGLAGTSGTAGKAKEASPAFEIAVGAILTQNTAWRNVEKAIANLASRDLLTPGAMNETPIGEIRELIRPSGYYNVKGSTIKNLTALLFSDYGGSLDELFKRGPEEVRRALLDLKGIGPETADSILLYGGGLRAFFVDAYTKRILKRHGLVGGKASYNKVQSLMVESLPGGARLYNEYHALIVQLGKEYCRPRNPRCKECPIFEDGVALE